MSQWRRQRRDVDDVVVEIDETTVPKTVTSAATMPPPRLALFRALLPSSPFEYVYASPPRVRRDSFFC